jgi:putative transposase
VIGGDLGLETYLTLSDGTEVENPRFLRQYAKKLRRAQRHLSRKVKGSCNRAKARLRVAKVYERVAHLRSNFSHHLTHKLMQYSALCLEGLSILGLARTKLAKSMLDAAFGEVVRQWKYKSV